MAVLHAVAEWKTMLSPFECVVKARSRRGNIHSNVLLLAGESIDLEHPSNGSAKDIYITTILNTPL